MNVDRNLEKEVLTRLLHAHPQGLGKEVLDNYRGERRSPVCWRSYRTAGLSRMGM